MQTNTINNKTKADVFWKIAMDRYDNLDKEEDIRTIDRTQLFDYWLSYKIQKNKLINININGPVREGKSTAALTLMLKIKRMIEKYKKIERPIKESNICRDQNEYARLVKRRPESYKHECDVIDEWSAMEMTGYNATIEEKYLKDFSDRQASRYYHRIACSPQNITDENSEIILSVVPSENRNGTTLCLLKYRLDNISEPILIGHININVTEVLEAPWYQTYLKRKEEKYELMNKYNVQSPRELEYAEIILNTYNEIKDGAKIGLTSAKHLKMELREQMDKKGVWFSILGDKDVLQTLEGLAEKTKLIFDYSQKIKYGKLVPERQELYKKQLNKVKAHLGKELTMLETKMRLWERYQAIDDTKTLK